VNKVLTITILFIAACAISTGATGQKVFRCGNSYSQTPCPDAMEVNTEDLRSKAQKLQSDKAIARDVSTANTLEKTRLKGEAQTLANRASESKTSSKKPRKSTAVTSEPKKKAKKNAPEFFTAAAPPAQKKELAQPAK
jgi:hypothetical protein